MSVVGVRYWRHKELKCSISKLVTWMIARKLLSVHVLDKYLPTHLPPHFGTAGKASVVFGIGVNGFCTDLLLIVVDG